MRTFSVYYMKPEYFRDGTMGSDWLREHNMLPDPGALDKTHVFLLEAQAADLEQLYMAMQGERWSPKGEARPLIRMKGLQHTSMSVGDVAVDQDTWDAWMVERFGFTKLTGPNAADRVPTMVAEFKRINAEKGN